MANGDTLSIVHYVPTTRFSVGGTVRAAMDICSVLARRGHEVTWLTPDATDVPDSWKAGEANCPRLVELNPLRALGRLDGASLERAKPCIQQADVIHIHALWCLSNPQIASVARATGTPWVLSIHGMLDDWSMAVRGLKKRTFLRTIIRSMVSGAASILATAEEERRQASRWLPRDPDVIPLVMDMAPYETMPKADLARAEFGDTTDPVVLFLSRVHEKKSIETLIDAAAILKERGTRIRLLIAGTGDDAYLQTMQQRTREQGVSDQVEFLGMVVGDLKLSLYAMADLFALATQQENFGLVYPEAMLCGTPVLTTRGTDIWRELEESGMSIVDRTPTAFADGMATMLIDQKEALPDLGLRGREYVQKWLAPDVIAEQYETLYRRSST
ncbi:MAG: glycosyltransferase [Phycisphaerales bacterium]|nr:glycosyltransferase [Phycisphaerales bacterium]